MNKFLLCLLFLMTSFAASSQKVYFIYLQSEQEQPFFLKMNEKLYSSSTSGYLILAKLRDSTYHFSVGFPQNKWPEQKFAVALKAKDHGYLLKDFGEKGWGLFDLQTLSIQMALTDPVRTGTSKAERKEVSPFTDMLARVADDSTLRERPVVTKAEEVSLVEKVVEPEKKEETKTVVTDPQLAGKEEIREPAVEKVEEPKTGIKELPVDNTKNQKAVEVEYKRSVVTRRSGSSTPEGMGLIFIDEYADGIKDTIHIVIPIPQPAEVKEAAREEKKFLEVGTTGIDSVAVIKPMAEEPKPVAIESKTVKNNCKEVAAEADFLKLRKRMAAETDDDDMVDEARKYFKIKCFTTLQIKNLGALFLDDLGKYKFFDMAYIFVSDRESFASLQTELKNEYYINRFKAMLK